MPCSRKIGSSSLFTDFDLSEDSGIISYIKKNKNAEWISSSLRSWRSLYKLRIKNKSEVPTRE